MAKTRKPSRTGASGGAVERPAYGGVTPTLDRRALEGLMRRAAVVIGVDGAATDVDRAQDIMHDAWDADGPERVALARRALGISPLCADAYVLLAEESAASDAAAIEMYRLGVEAGELALGPQFEELKGEFWGWLRKRCSQPTRRAWCHGMRASSAVA